MTNIISNAKKRDENSDPFNAFPSPKPRVKPQPGWQKREFNGRKFYRIPVPKS